MAAFMGMINMDKFTQFLVSPKGLMWQIVLQVATMIGGICTVFVSVSATSETITLWSVFWSLWSQKPWTMILLHTPVFMSLILGMATTAWGLLLVQKEKKEEKRRQKEREERWARVNHPANRISPPTS